MNYLKLNGAWYIDALPTQIIVELQDGTLTKFNLIPFKIITDVDFTDYKGYHPRKCKGQPLPDYLYSFYGLEKNSETATEHLHLRLTQGEKTKLDDYAKSLDDKSTVSSVIKNYIKSL